MPTFGFKALLRSTLCKLGGKKKQEERLIRPRSEGGDEAATRRALLTGGLALAGASTLASSAEAAVTYVQLGAVNNTTRNTNVTSTNTRGLVGISRASNGIGVQGVGQGTPGIGVSGAGNYGSSSIGVQGQSATGIGVKGIATGSGYGVRGDGGYNGVYGSGTA